MDGHLTLDDVLKNDFQYDYISRYSHERFMSGVENIVNRLTIVMHKAPCSAARNGLLVIPRRTARRLHPRTTTCRSRSRR